ncbi:MAG: hypothetical protein ACLP5E_22755, partial [Streptosporangiaceae bacterium]
MTDEDGTREDAGPGSAFPVPVRVVDDDGSGRSLLESRITPYDQAPAAVSGSGQTAFVQGRAGWIYDIRLISVQTFTAGTVNVYKNAVADVNFLLPF